jgi:ribosome-binding protein aMBF1 (putative translation factor)
MVNCKWCQKEIEPHEIHIDNGQIIICASCTLKLHKASIEEGLIEYDPKLIKVVETQNKKILFSHIIIIALILVFSYFLKLI